VRKKHTLFALCAKVRSSNEWPMNTKLISCGMQPAMADDAHLRNSVNPAFGYGLGSNEKVGIVRATPPGSRERPAGS
jgi:hypothetical protein